jgi:MazG family protein
MKYSDKNLTHHFLKLKNTIQALRDPENGCPWDLKQTHESLRRYMIEEAYEAVEVMSPYNRDGLVDELGDVLLQVLLNSEIARQNGDFTLIDVFQNLEEKMVRRHPHVFKKDSKSSTLTNADIKENWSNIKNMEKKRAGTQNDVSKKIREKSLVSEISLHDGTPASKTAIRLGKSVSKVNFDWRNSDEVVKQVKSELNELIQAMDENDASAIYEEMGDLLFTVAQLCRHLDIDPELCGIDSNIKFKRRFLTLEQFASLDKKTLAKTSKKEMQTLWKTVKINEKKLSKKRAKLSK